MKGRREAERERESELAGSNTLHSGKNIGSVAILPVSRKQAIASSSIHFLFVRAVCDALTQAQLTTRVLIRLIQSRVLNLGQCRLLVMLLLLEQLRKKQF